MTWRFQRLSTVRIFSRATDQPKKATINGTLAHQTLFQGKRTQSWQPMTLWKDLTPNKLFLLGIHHSLSSPSCLIFAKYNTLKNKAKASTSQSWAALVKLTLHWMASPKHSPRVATEASFMRAIPHTTGNDSLRAVSSHQRSCQILYHTLKVNQNSFGKIAIFRDH